MTRLQASWWLDPSRWSRSSLSLLLPRRSRCRSPWPWWGTFLWMHRYKKQQITFLSGRRVGWERHSLHDQMDAGYRGRGGWSQCHRIFEGRYFYDTFLVWSWHWPVFSNTLLQYLYFCQGISRVMCFCFLLHYPMAIVCQNKMKVI